MEIFFEKIFANNPKKHKNRIYSPTIIIEPLELPDHSGRTESENPKTAHGTLKEDNDMNETNKSNIIRKQYQICRGSPWDLRCGQPVSDHGFQHSGIFAQKWNLERRKNDSRS